MGKVDYSKPPKVFYEEHPSEEFLRSLEETFHAGTVSISCELCGRTTFNSDDRGCFDPGELNELLEQAKKYPEWFVDVDYTVTWGHVDGKQIVIGCPCNGLKKHEDWILDHKYIILRYLAKMVCKNFNEAKTDYDNVFYLAKILEEEKKK